MFVVATMPTQSGGHGTRCSQTLRTAGIVFGVGRRRDFPAEFFRGLANVFLPLLFDKIWEVLIPRRWRIGGGSFNDTNADFIPYDQILFHPLEVFARFTDAMAKSANGEFQPGRLGFRSSRCSPMSQFFRFVRNPGENR